MMVECDVWIVGILLHTQHTGKARVKNDERGYP